MAKAARRNPLVMITSLVAVLFFPVSKMTLALIVSGCCAAAFAIFLAAEVIHGRAESTLLLWIFLFPLGYYFFSFPQDRPLVSLDRAVIGMILVGIAFTTHAGKPVQRNMQQAGLAWTLFVVAAWISLRQVPNPLGDSKQLADVFVLPALLGYYVVRYFPARRYMRTVHLLTCGMVVYVAAIGVAEMILARDLLALPGAVFIMDESGSFPRVNGPFSTNNTFGLVGLISLMFLLFSGRVIWGYIGSWQRTFHVFGLAASLCIALLPMFRSMALTLALIILLAFYFDKRIGARIGAVVIVTAAIAGMTWLQLTAPEFFAKRVRDPADVYARVAQYRQTLHLFLDHPLGGTGFNNYIESAAAKPEINYRGVVSVGSAHNTLATVLAETGLTGTIPYIFSQVLLFRAIWALRKRGTRHGALCATSFLYVYLSYWVTGLTLTSGYYSDLNLWYVFVATTIYKFGITEPANRDSFPVRSKGEVVVLERPAYEQI